MSVAAIVINLGYAAVSVGLAVAWYRITRRPSEQARAEAARPRPDSRWGTDAELQDACELIWDMPEFKPTADDPELDAGCERLWQAIRDEQQKGADDA